MISQFSFIFSSFKWKMNDVAIWIIKWTSQQASGLPRFYNRTSCSIYRYTGTSKNLPKMGLIVQWNIIQVVILSNRYTSVPKHRYASSMLTTRCCDSKQVFYSLKWSAMLEYFPTKKSKYYFDMYCMHYQNHWYATGIPKSRNSKIGSGNKPTCLLSYVTFNARGYNVESKQILRPKLNNVDKKLLLKLERPEWKAMIVW